MKQFMNWLEQRDQKRSASPDYSVLENVKEAYLSCGAHLSGVDFVMCQYYGDYNH